MRLWRRAVQQLRHWKYEVGERDPFLKGRGLSPDEAAQYYSDRKDVIFP